MASALQDSNAKAFAAADPPTLQQNLQALRKQQPRIADFIEACLIPLGVSSAIGRDGAPTLTLSASDGRPVWFGGSSMPTVSAAEMFSGASGDSGNVTLPGIGTGYEARAILGKLPQYRALFVIESDPVALRLAFHLHDYSPAIAERRLVFARGAALADDLVEYFARHPGHELPTRMFTVPWKRAAESAELQRRLELAGERVIETQSREVKRLTQLISRVPRRELPASPSVVVISTDPSPTTREWLPRATRGLEELGWGGAGAFPGLPDECHIAARLSAIEAAGPDWVLVVNGFPGPLRALLPTEMPIVTWFTLSGSVPTQLGAPVGPADLFFTASTSQWEALRQAGVPVATIRSVGVGGESRTRPEPQTGVAVVADVPDARAQSCGINLQSHVALWDAMSNICQEAVRRWDRATPADLLERAQASSGVRVREAQVRNQFLTLCDARLLPATMAAAAVSTLRHANCEVGVWGGGWASLAGGGVSSQGPIPRGDGLCRILASAKVLVVPMLGAVEVETAMEAIAVGTGVVAVGNRDEFEASYPGLAPAAAAITFCPSISDLPSFVRSQIGLGRGGKTLPPTMTMTGFLSRMRDEIQALNEARGKQAKEQTT